ncbi:arylesterase [Halopseudomonas sp. Lyrl_26]|uniref:arylesterase n=1 Tax=Halopseudomonas sp. Lyrl_26 TaxID=3110923 RepID=UPI003F7ECA7D
MTVLKRCAAGVLLLLLALPVPAQNILLIGDSISAAFGLEIEQGWVSLLQKRLADQDYPHRVVNASVSGETTAGGLARLPVLLEQVQPELVIIELGGNDGLRGLPAANMQQNLSAMVEQSRASGADVILLGMRIPPNYGPRYNDAFEQVFVDLSQSLDVPLVPFLLEGVGTVPELMLDDGIHPGAAAQPLLLDNAWPVIRQWLDGIDSR